MDNSFQDGVILRGIQPEDAAPVAALGLQLGYERTVEQIQAWISQREQEPGLQAAFVACLDGKVVGWIEVSIVQHLQGARHGLIGGLVVDQAVRGAGIGKRLVDRAEAWAWGHEVEEMVVTSRSTREAAHRFYLRGGYRTVKTSVIFAKSRAR